MNAKSKKIIWWGMALAYFATLAFLCFWNFKPSADLPRSIFGIPSDKIVHFCMFVPFPVISYYGFHKRNGKIGRFFLWFALMYIIGIALAYGIEVGQSFTGYRSYDLMDFAADSSGLSLSSIVIVHIAAITQKW